MMEKHLDGTGKGEFLYDYNNDILMFKIKDRDYKNSVEFQNFVKWGFKTSVESGMITVRLSFVGQVRNKEVPVENFTQQLTTSLNGHNLIDSSVECAVA